MDSAIVTPIRVRYSEVDSMKWANHGAYARWFEVGRAEFMRQRGLSYKKLEDMGFYMPITELYCKYIQSIKYDDLIHIATWPSRIRRASVRFEYKLLNNGDVMARAYTDHVCLDGQREIVRMPAVLLDIFKEGQ